MTLSANLLFSTEDAVANVLATVDNSFLTKHNLDVNGVVFTDGNHELLFNDLGKLDFKVVPGGAGFVVLKCAQWLLNMDKSVTTFLGYVGKDKDADDYRKEAQKHNVTAKLVELDDYSTRRVATCVTGKNRSMVSRLARGVKFDHHLDSPENWKLVEDAKYYYLSGYLLNVASTLLTKVANHANAKGKLLSFSLSAPTLAVTYKDFLYDFLKSVDLLFGSFEDAVALGKVVGLNTTDPKEVGTKLLTLKHDKLAHEKHVVFFDFEDGVVVVTNKGVLTFPAATPKLDDVVDTTGVHHAFWGGYLSQLLLDKPLEDRVRAGQYAASVVSKQYGPTVPNEKPTFK